MPDVVIAGGGVVAHALAYHLLTREARLDVLIVERDRTYRMASTGLSVGGVRQQWGTALNALVCREAVAFYERAADFLDTGEGPVDVGFHQNGYLFLATPKSLPGFRRRAAMAQELGIPVRILTPGEAQTLVPGLVVDDIAGASYCATDGYLDPHLVLQAFRAKARALGARGIEDEVTEVVLDGGRLCGVRTREEGLITAGQVVVAAGGWSPMLLAPTGLDLPVRLLRRQVYISLPQEPLGEIPLTIDPTGVHFRPETGGRLLLAGSVPSDGPGLPLDWDRDAFVEHIWVHVAHRVPSLETMRLEHGWAGYYDDNFADHNAIVGRHPGVEGLYLVTGFSGHGLMQCPTVTRALAELMLAGRFETLDLSPLRPERFAQGDLVLERSVI